MSRACVETEVTITILETAPNVWTRYRSTSAAAKAHGLTGTTVSRYLDRHGSGAGWYRRQAWGGKRHNSAAIAEHNHLMEMEA